MEKFRYIKIAALYYVLSHMVYAFFGSFLSELFDWALPPVMISGSAVLSFVFHCRSAEKTDFSAIIAALAGTTLYIIIEVIKILIYVRWILPPSL